MTVSIDDGPFVAMITLIVIGVGVIVGLSVWFYLKKKCSAEKLGTIADSDADVIAKTPIVVSNKPFKNSPHRSKIVR